ncbi:hypothetical protein GCM10027454_02280 [Algoriphagus aestuariicola]
MYKIQDVVRGDHGKEILEVGDEIQKKEEEREERNRVAKRHGARPFADVVLLELLDKDPDDIVEIFVGVTEIDFFQMPCLQLQA